MDWTSLIIGVIAGWIIALIVYGFYTRNREANLVTGTLASDSAGAQEAHRAQLQEAEAGVAQLEAELAAAKTARSEALAEANAEIERLQAELARQEVASPVLAAAPEAQLPPAEHSDLKRVEGIGPKIEEILNNAGIYTFEQLAGSSVERVQEILADAGERFSLADPDTWPEQARLAVAERWEELAVLQDRLKAGRE